MLLAVATRRSHELSNSPEMGRGAQASSSGFQATTRDRCPLIPLLCAVSGQRSK